MQCICAICNGMADSLKHPFSWVIILTLVVLGQTVWALHGATKNVTILGPAPLKWGEGDPKNMPLPICVNHAKFGRSALKGVGMCGVYLKLWCAGALPIGMGHA